MSESKALSLAAVDLGASSGRVMLARFVDGRLSLEEAHRFENRAVHLPDATETGVWCWDSIALYDEIKRGLALAARNAGRLDAIGIDSWGVDYALFDAAGRLVRPPVAYRDPRTDPVYPRVIEKLGRERIYERTGIQFMPLNTIYQLAADAEDPGQPLERSDRLLMTPQMLGFWLTGEQHGEHTLASTTQLYDTAAGDWVREFARALDIPTGLLPETVSPGTSVGRLRPSLAQELGINSDAAVVAVGSHDTASAVVGAPLAGPASAYLSSGTWSLLGLELDEPCRTPEALAANLTNEAGVGGKTRCLRNIAGLWLLQECRRNWAQAGRAFSFAELVELAQAAPPFAAVVAPDHPRFSKPCDMPAELVDQCRAQGMDLSPEPGPVVRCVLESLALRYAQTLADIARISGRSVNQLNIVGGGSNNALLNRFTADAIAMPVEVGPGEATAIGNALVQAMALGEIADLDQAREVVRQSFPTQRIEPDTAHADDWRAALDRFLSLPAA